MANPKCSKCGSSMVERKNRATGRTFWGCLNYPNCQGGRPVFTEEKVDIGSKNFDSFKASVLQLNLKNEFFTSTRHLLVRAVAGSGKSTTMMWMIQFFPNDLESAFCCFDKNNADKNRIKAQEYGLTNTIFCTFHSLGKKNIESEWGKVDVNNSRVLKIIESQIDLDSFDDEENRLLFGRNFNNAVKLVEYLKGNLVDFRQENIENELNFLVDYHDMEFETEEDKEICFDIVNFAFYKSIKTILDSAKNHEKITIDFADMIYIPAMGLVSCKQFDRFLSDETQDLNKAQIAFLLRSVKYNGQVLAVGDDFQSIYSFRGADSHAMENVRIALNAKVMPLSESFRCPKAVARLVNGKFSFPFSVPDSAIEGKVEDLKYNSMLNMVQDEDIILCRNNAPLAKVCLKLLAQGKKANIKKSNFVENLIVFINRIVRNSGTHDIVEFSDFLQDYCQKETERLIKIKKEYKASLLNDQVETILALAESEDVNTTKDLIKKLDDIFNDDKKGILLSTIHGMKGQEAKRVFFYAPELLPSSFAKTEEAKQQESNLYYVAITRTLDELYFVAENKER